MGGNEIMDKLQEMKRIIDELNMASDAYYNSGDVLMSDATFDAKLEYLSELEKETGTVLSNSPTQNVGATVLSVLNKATHEFKAMKSLKKVHSSIEIVEFAKTNGMVASLKMDGLSVRLTYIDGILNKAETRGDGFVGSDVTEHAKFFKNIPIKIDKVGTYVVDGEAIIAYPDFESINKNGEFKNPRNLAAGTLSQLDTKIVADRKISFILWDVITGDEADNYYQRLLNAEELGFEVVENCVNGGLSIDEIEDLNSRLTIEAKEKGFPIDGIVWRINFDDVGNSLGETDHHFNNAVAWKPANELHRTTLKDIEWTMGKTGVLTPTAVFEAVEIDGTTVERASLSNISVSYETLGVPYVEQVIFVTKRNQIIPKVEYAENKYEQTGYRLDGSLAEKFIYPPDTCPICGGKTSINGGDVKLLTCTNPSCSGKLLGRLSAFVSKDAMDIDGLSEKTLDKFIDLGWLDNLLDVYKLVNHKADIANLPGFGIKSANKIVDSIEKSKTVKLEKFINALQIPMVGRSQSREIAKTFESWSLFVDAMQSGFDFTSLDGFGSVLNMNIHKWYCSHYHKDGIEELANLMTFKTEEVKENTGTDFTGMTFCVTGKVEIFKNRKEIEQKIIEHGGKLYGSVSAKTDYLLTNDTTSGSSKLKNAAKFGTKIISEKEFVEMLGE